MRVKVILDNLAEGHTAEQIVKSYPSLTYEDFNDWVGCVVVANDHKLRIKKPKEENN